MRRTPLRSWVKVSLLAVAWLVYAIWTSRPWLLILVGVVLIMVMPLLGSQRDKRP